MSNTKETRVLSRQTAREVTQEEMGAVNGGVRTLTVCTFDEQFGKDGDVGEC
jgi:hypothetical protein